MYCRENKNGSRAVGGGDSRELTFIQWGLKMLKKQKFWAVDRKRLEFRGWEKLVVIAVSINS